MIGSNECFAAGNYILLPRNLVQNMKRNAKFEYLIFEGTTYLKKLTKKTIPANGKKIKGGIEK